MGMRGRAVTADSLDAPAAIRWLGRSWWLLCPAFAALTLRLGVERACADPYDLLPALTSSPGWAWPLALVYVLTHAWLAVAYVAAAARAGSLLPSGADWRAIWGAGIYKVFAIAAALAIEYAPLAWWHWLGAMWSC